MMSLYVLKIYMMIWYYVCNTLTYDNDARNDEIFMIKLLFCYSWLESSFPFANDKGGERVANVLSWIDVKGHLKKEIN